MNRKNINHFKQIKSAGRARWQKVIDFTKIKSGGINIDELLSKF